MTPTQLRQGHPRFKYRLTPAACNDVKKPRLCLVGNGDCNVDANRLLVDMAHHHHRDRFQLSFIVPDTVDGPAREIADSDCEVFQTTTSPGSRSSSTYRLTKFFRRGRFDIAHFNSGRPDCAALLAAKIAGIRVVVQTLHDKVVFASRRQQIQRWFAKRLIDGLVRTQRDVGDRNEQQSASTENRSFHIKPGIDVLRIKYVGPTLQPTALTVASFTGDDHCALLLRAARVVLESLPTFRLVIRGNGPERGNMIDLAQNIGIANSVRFVAPGEELVDRDSAGLYVATSSSGRLTNLLDAMASGLPIVATDNSQHRTAVIPNKTGFLVPNASEEALAKSLLHACDKMSTWPEMGRLARRRVEGLFGAEDTVRQYERLYQGLLRPDFK